MNFYDFTQDKQIEIFDEMIDFSYIAFRYLDGRINPKNRVVQFIPLITNLMHADNRRVYGDYAYEGTLTICILNIIEDQDWSDYKEGIAYSKLVIVDTLIHELYHAEQDHSFERLDDVDLLELEVEIATTNYIKSHRNELELLLGFKPDKMYSAYILNAKGLPHNHTDYINNIIKFETDSVNRYIAAAARLINYGFANMLNTIKHHYSIIFKLPNGYNFYLKSYGQLSNFENFVQILYYLRGRYDWYEWRFNLLNNICYVEFEDGAKKHAVLQTAVDFQWKV